MDYKALIGERITEDRTAQLHKIIKALGNICSPDFYFYLTSFGFCDAPASTKYHGNYIGGLYDHSIEVTRALVELTEKLGLNWAREESPIIVGLFHDLCKIDAYCYEKREDGPVTFSYNTDTILPGHGEKSVMLLQKHIELTDEEMLCIRWHMGAFDDKDNWNYYGRAIEKYPNVLYTHTADMIASKIKGI